MHIVPNGNMTSVRTWATTPQFTVGVDIDTYLAEWTRLRSKERVEWTAKFSQ